MTQILDFSLDEQGVDLGCDTEYQVIFCVVVYKQEIQKCKTVKSLVQHQKLFGSINMLTLVVDNSEEEGIAANNLEGDVGGIVGDLEVCFTKRNESLAKIYNWCWEKYRSDVYVFLDQDSGLDQAYFECVVDSLYLDCNLVVPKVVDPRNPEVLYSPKRQPLVVDFLNKYRVEGFEVDVSGDLDSKNIFSVLSGLVVKRRVFLNGVVFDEDFSLYGIDSKFLHDYSKVFSKVRVMHSYMHHSLSYFEGEEKKNPWRFIKREEAKRVLVKKGMYGVVRCIFLGFFKSMALSLKYRNWRYIQMFFELHLGR